MGRPNIKEKKKAHPNDVMLCVICEKEYTRSNKSKHMKSAVHKACENLLNKRQSELPGWSDKLKGGKLKQKFINDSESDDKIDQEEQIYKELKKMRSKKTGSHSNNLKNWVSKKSESESESDSESEDIITLSKEGAAYLNNPNVPMEAKHKYIDSLPSTKNRSNIISSNELYHNGNAENLKRKIRDIGRF